jgi:nicotinamidase-related amidase
MLTYWGVSHLNRSAPLFLRVNNQTASVSVVNESIWSASLIDADDSVLIVIDVQVAFLDKLSPGHGGAVLDRICWLVSVAQWKDVPLVVTAEELQIQPMAPRLVDALPGYTKVFDKHYFGLAHQGDILAAIGSTGRRTAVLVGLETDVCVLHSTLGLLEKGYRVAVVADATGTPPEGQALALARMQAAGATIVSTKGVFFEWLRTVDEYNRFEAERPDLVGLPGISL